MVRRSRAILKELESAAPAPAVQTVAPREESDQLSFGNFAEQEVLEALRRAQPDALTPIEALSLLYELKQKLK